MAGWSHVQLYTYQESCCLWCNGVDVEVPVYQRVGQVQYGVKQLRVELLAGRHVWYIII